MFRDRTEEWWHPQQGANARARFLLGMNETAPPGETQSSLAFYGMGAARCSTRQLCRASVSTCPSPDRRAPARHIASMPFAGHDRGSAAGKLQNSLKGYGMGAA